ncbi:hypothetical protein ACFQ0B_76810 [Nonomuraea thailandensis]
MPASLRALRFSSSADSSPSSTSETNTTTSPAVRTPPMPPGRVATWRASPPARGSSHSAGTSSPGSLAVGSGRAEVNSTSPASVKTAADSPLAERVSRYGSPSSGTAQSAVPNDLPSGLRD